MFVTFRSVYENPFISGRAKEGMENTTKQTRLVHAKLDIVTKEFLDRLVVDLGIGSISGTLRFIITDYYRIRYNDSHE